MRKFRRKLNSVLILWFVCALLGGVTAFAQNACSLRVQIEDSFGEPVKGFGVELFCVARASNSMYELTSDFAGLGITVQELVDEPGAELAAQVSQYVYDKRLVGTEKTTAQNGEAVFSSLEKGVYLVLERGGQTVTFQPYLVVLSSQNNEESEVVSVPKTSETETATFSVIKMWNDYGNTAGKRPKNVEVRLLRNGIPFRSVILNDGNRWQHVFSMLPKDGVYTVEEVAVPYYKANYVPIEDGYVIINHYEGSPGGGGGGGGGAEPLPEPANVFVKKVRDDNNDVEGKRPNHVTVQLIEDGTVIKTASLRDSNSWQHTFKNLDSSKRYTVQEIAVEGYSVSYEGNAATGIVITNTYTEETEPGVPPIPVIPEPVLIDIPIRVDWVDESNAYQTRPEQVTIYLLVEGNIASLLEVNQNNRRDNPAIGQPVSSSYYVARLSLSYDEEQNRWYGVFKDIPANLSYSVWQIPVTDYTTVYSGDVTGGLVITNTYMKGVTDPGVPPEPMLPEQPEIPPGQGDVPTEKPSGPYIPQTGTEVFPAYLLMAAGVMLVLLGLIDLYKGREE